MSSSTVLLDLRGLAADQQVDRLKEQYRLLRGKDVLVRARVGAPAHIAFSPDSELVFIGCEATDQLAVVDLRNPSVIELVRAGL